MILSLAVSSFAFISGTTNFLVGSILHADELSITVMPASAKAGAHCNEVPPPAENNATAGFMSIAVCMLTTLYCFPLNATSLPTDFSEATGINSVTGKFLSAKTCNILVPTKPVAPTTATFMFSFLTLAGWLKKSLPILEGCYIFESYKLELTFPVGLFTVLLCMFYHFHAGCKTNHERIFYQIFVVSPFSSTKCSARFTP